VRQSKKKAEHRGSAEVQQGGMKVKQLLSPSNVDLGALNWPFKPRNA